MVNFCNMCGQRLMDEKPCTCQLSDKNKQNNFSPEGFKNSKVGIELLEAKGIFLSFLNNPKSTTLEYAKKSNFIPALIILGLQAILFALFATIAANSIFGLFYGLLDTNPSFAIFVRMLFFGIIQIPVFILAIFAICKIFKVDLSLTSTTSLVGVGSIPYVAALAVSVILGSFAPQVAILLIFAGFLASILIINYTLNNFDKTGKETTIYLLPLAWVVYFIVVYLFFRVML